MIPRVKPEGMLFGNPASTPDHVRGGFFRIMLQGGAYSVSVAGLQALALFAI